MRRGRTWHSRNVVPRMQRGSVPVRKTPFPPDVLSGGFLLFPLAQRRYASPERGGACEAGGGVRKRRIRWGLSSACPSRQCRPSISKKLLRIRKKKPAASIYGGWFRVLSGGSKCVQAQPAQVGSADRQSAGNPADSKKPAAPIYGGWFRVLSGGSKCVQAQPVRIGSADSPRPRRESCGFKETSRFNLWRLVSCSVRRQQVRAGSACPNRQCRPSIRRESCGFGETSRFNLWRLVSVFCPATASACRLSLSESAVPTVNPQGILRIRRNQPLQSMAAGFAFCPAAASGCRLSLRRPPLERFLFVFLTADLQPARFESTKVLYTDSTEK